MITSRDDSFGLQSYRDWNNALLDYFLGSQPRGTRIFLSPDDDILGVIGRDHGFSEDAPAAFCRAVRHQVIRENRDEETVDLRYIQGRDEVGRPRYVAFLALMVLAATRMSEDEWMGQTNYFGRFRTLLRLPMVPGRPVGMEHGETAEEPFWKDWNQWLQQSGYLPTAQRGDGPTTFTNYPIGQTLLRDADREKLSDFYAQQRWHTQEWDGEMLLWQLRRDAGGLTKHLERLIRPGIRDEPIAAALREHYEAWRSAFKMEALGASRPGSAAIVDTLNLFAGLYRSENPITGDVSYYLLPRASPRTGNDTRVGNGTLKITVESVSYPLVESRPGWFQPIAVVSARDIAHGAHYPFVSPSPFEALILPGRSFWLLTPDPEDPEEGRFASWRSSVAPDTPFFLLCPESALADLQMLREERLLDWADEPSSLGNGWIELPYAMVLTYDWAGFNISDMSLFEALRPRSTVSLGLGGGLRAPGGGWLDGNGPHVTVYGFYDSVRVRVTNAATGFVTHDASQEARIPQFIDWRGPGDYYVEAYTSTSTLAGQLVRIVHWDDLMSAPPYGTPEQVFGQWHLQGALLRAMPDGKIDKTGGV